MNENFQNLISIQRKTKEKYQPLSSSVIYGIFRMGVALLFFLHGAEKLFDFPTFARGIGSTVPLFSLIWFSGVFEFFGGLAVILGLFTRPIAIILAMEMFIAYFMVHAPSGLSPLENKGELAVMYFLCFLLIGTLGAGRWSLERVVFGKELI